MFHQDLRERILEAFEPEFKNPRRNVYLKEYYVSESFNRGSISDIIGTITDDNDFEASITDTGSTRIDTILEDEPVIFAELRDNTWLVVFSSNLPRSLIRSLRGLSNEFTWILDSWVKGEDIESLYTKYSPRQKSVDIERKWDPYWVYQQGSQIPEDMAEYFNNNIDEFVEQEIELSVKTPQRLVEETLKQGVRQELLEKSELSESTFTVAPPEGVIVGDGGVLSADNPSRIESNVTVDQSGEFVHKSGDPSATFFAYEEGTDTQDLRETFREAYPEKTYTETSGGIQRLDSYSSAKTVRISFEAKDFNEEISIKLLNLLTVGHNDVEVHGVLDKKEGKSFVVQAYTSFDQGEYTVRFDTSDDYVPTLYITPISGTPEGLIHIYKKLREKIDPRVDVGVVNAKRSVQ